MVDALRREAVETELLKLYLNRDQVGSVLTRQEYETKASQIAAEIRRLETRAAAMQQHNSSRLPIQKESREPMRLLKAVQMAAQKATFQEKQTPLRLLGIQVLHGGKRIEMTVAVPTPSIELEDLPGASLLAKLYLPPQS